jgi:ubiquinone/menaquinone biosynthesis C-methylase UbiE
MNTLDTFTEEHTRYTNLRAEHWDNLAERQAGVLSRHYRNRLAEIYRHVVGECESILEIGCGNGELLNALNPTRGLGVDFSPKMIAQAEIKYPNIHFLCGDAQTFDLGAVTFDVIILSDLLNDLWDVQAVFTHLHRYCNRNTRIIFNVFSHAWESPRHVTEALGQVTPTLPQNWLTPIDVHNLVDLAGYEQVRRWEEILCPLPIPWIARFFNQILVKMPLFRLAALTNFYVIRPHGKSCQANTLPSVSVIVAARNESGHIEELLQRIPAMGSHTEIIFVEGNSTDDTYEVIEGAIANTAKDCKLLKQPGKGKGDAVRAGFEIAKGDI